MAPRSRLTFTDYASSELWSRVAPTCRQNLSWPQPHVPGAIRTGEGLTYMGLRDVGSPSGRLVPQGQAELTEQGANELPCQPLLERE